jgi:hypothetical protein
MTDWPTLGKLFFSFDVAHCACANVLMWFEGKKNWEK